MVTPQDLLVALARAFALSETFSGDHRELEAALEVTLSVQREAGWKIVRVGGDEFQVGDEKIPAQDGELGQLREALTEARVAELRFQEPPRPERLLAFLRRLGGVGIGSGEAGFSRFRGLEDVVGLSFRRGDESLAGMSASIERLFQVQPESVEEEEEERGATAQVTGEGGEMVLAGPPLPPDLASLVKAFLAARGPNRPPLGEAIAAAGARLRDARDLVTLGDLVETLAEAFGEGAGDPEAQDLAVRLTTPGVASQIAGRIASNREEGERERLTRVAARLGREMALALTDALGEARDRYQRRVFMEAILAQGDLAREMAQRMVKDPRWYVVRNGVSLLGELGGKETISSLTSTLANQDPRVRKETVLALAKIGGEDAAMLLLGMLDDTEAEVREKACWAAGLLKVDKALKPLLVLAEKDGHQGVQIESLQALGKLGDPGAVPIIEKKAVGRLFSKPPRDVRIAAYRALSSIGTPHSKELLLKATKDSDSEIRKVALGLLK